jgi:16S rRNA (cytosine1402-N4)-methyltransferase
MSMPPLVPAVTAGSFSTAAGTRVIAIDRDLSAVTAGFDLVDRSDGRLTLVEDRFSNLAEICAAQGVDAVDGVVMDVGVSSMQLDEAERGFSFRLDGPLDMRMGHAGPTAADVIAKASEADLANIIYIFGEERHSRAVARAIIAGAQASADYDDAGARRYRRKGGAVEAGRDPPGDADVSGFKEFSSTRNSTSCIWRCRQAERVLKPGGRLVAGVVSFAGRPHRQEFPGRARQGRRRIAASAVVAQAAPSFHILTKRPVTPDDDEVAANPRARSAKLRAGRA